MKKTLILALGLTLGSYSLHAQSFEAVNPKPQKISAVHGQFVSVPATANYLHDNARANTYPLADIQQWITPSAEKAMTIVLGVKGDKAVRPFAKHIPNTPEGYYLHVTPGKIIIAGTDERGLYYGIQTLKQSMKDGRLPVGTVTDFPDVKYRGVVEGFYGKPWSHRDRLSQLDFYGKHKLNVYIYGPKDDPYHSVPNWRKAYPVQEAEQIRALVKHANKNGVIFYWAIHPGQDIKWTAEDRDLLLAKFEMMYQLGVRAFAVFFDDISGEGTKADKQAELLNYIDNNFIQKKKDVEPLVMCPTEYNKSWSNIEKGYLPTLGDKLNKGIEIMWTGNTVIACIDKPDMAWINGHIKRKAYIWWNFPVSDYVRDHLLLGPTYGNSLDIKDDLAGFLSNPMERAEASKIALFSVADYTWNMKHYDSNASWENAMKEVLPNEAAALRTFAAHNSDLGPNGHRFRRDESVDLQPALHALWDSKGTDASAALAVANECMRLKAAADVLMASKSNVHLIDEIRPWLKQSKLLGEYGQQVILLRGYLMADNKIDFLSTYQHIRALQTLMYEVDSQENQNPYQPGVKVGSKVLQPTLDSLFTYTTNEYNKAYGAQLATQAAYMPFSIESDVPQLATLPLRTRGNVVNVTPSNEVIRWNKGASFIIKAERGMKIEELMFDLGTKEIASAFTFEVLSNGTWQSASLKQQADNTRIFGSPDIKGLPVQAIRLTQNKETELQVHFKTFKITLANK